MSNPSSGTEPKIGILVPTLWEQKCLSRSGPDVGYQAITGMGKVNAALSAARAILYEECDVILLVGFCGGLQGLEVGDVVFPNTVLEADFDAGTLEPSPRIMMCGRAYQMPGKIASFFTADRFVKDPNELKAFSRLPKHALIAIEMEAWGVMQACLRFGAHFECVRVVSDIVGKNTEGDFLDSCRKLKPVLNDAVEKAAEVIRRNHVKNG